MSKIGIIGSGSWGLALSFAINRSNSQVAVWINSNKKLMELKKTRVSKYLPKIKIPRKIKLTDELDFIIENDYIFLVTPSQRLRENLELIRGKKIISKKFVICSKGIEKKTNKLMTEVFNEVLPKNKVIILSGPNFASEVAKNLPTAFVLSSTNKNELSSLGNSISSKNFRPYFNDDVIGTQIGGSFKNVIAIACGIVLGKKLGENARASILTRGLREITSLGVKLGAKEETFKGLSGLGDLNLSCNSLKSRNMMLGYKLGRGLSIKTLIKSNILNEGINSCASICEIGKLNKINLPICNSVKEVLEGNSISNIISKLLSRPLQFEK
ncbi:NAD(P)-dependent glycerol-3-phosphate dehydrogenase [Rickettsiales bacterium]|nr:NAD(P)-dependent glycerol-3-phosphate dehydrogenase [Rickettsiales bacterium]